MGGPLSRTSLRCKRNGELCWTHIQTCNPLSAVGATCNPPLLLMTAHPPVELKAAAGLSQDVAIGVQHTNLNVSEGGQPSNSVSMLSCMQHANLDRRRCRIVGVVCGFGTHGCGGALWAYDSRQHNRHTAARCDARSTLPFVPHKCGLTSFKAAVTRSDRSGVKSEA